MAFVKLIKRSLTNVHHLETPSYSLAIFLDPLIEPITKNDIAVKIVLNSLRKYVKKS